MHVSDECLSSTLSTVLMHAPTVLHTCTACFVLTVCTYYIHPLSLIASSIAMANKTRYNESQVLGLLPLCPSGGGGVAGDVGMGHWSGHQRHCIEEGCAAHAYDSSVSVAPVWRLRRPPQR